MAYIVMFSATCLVSSAAGNDPISSKSSLSSIGAFNFDNELTSVGDNDVFFTKDETSLIGDCKSLYILWHM